MQPIKDVTEVMKNLAELIAFVFGSGWAWFKIREYRQFKNWVELDLDSHVYKLDSPVEADAYTWTREGERITKSRRLTHAVEILLKFSNKGSTRLRLFNIQVGVNTMRAEAETQFDVGDGHLHLTRIFTSGNLVPEMQVEGKPIELTSFYYIEPSVTQTIAFSTLIPQPRELLQVFVQFSLTQRRIFPHRLRLPDGLYPHTAVRTYKIDGGDILVDVPPR
jgi:hypothetical protein